MRPDVAVVTNLGVVHLETFGTREVLADATMTTLMMTMSAYSGRRVTKDFILNKSKWQFGPNYDELSMDMELPIQPVPSPGKVPLV